MKRKRRKTFRIKTAAQLKAISSPVSFAIIQTLKQKGPLTVAKLGPKMGRKPNSLHYHIRKLLKIGMIRKVGTQRSGARTEVVYDVVANRFEGSDLNEKPELRKLANESVASLLRLAARNFAEASQIPEIPVEKGKKRNIHARHYSARLTEDQLIELNSYFDKIQNVFASNIGSETGQMYSMTMVFNPLPGVNK